MLEAADNEMTYDDLRELHNINSIVNLGSILELGIVSNYTAATLPHHSVAMTQIQDIRATVVIPNTNRKLHSYANLYINARNMMMFKRKDIHSKLCVIRVDKSILTAPNVVVSDQNASSGYVRFGSGVAGLMKLDKDTIFARYWTHPNDQIAQIRHGSAMCAEVLVPNVVPTGYIMGIYVSSEATAETVRSAFPDLQIDVNGDLFFQ